MAVAQDLNCKVQVNSNMIQGTNKQVFTTLEKVLNELMNARRWTDNSYTPGERIDCSFTITVKSYANNLFATELQVQARRPVFNSTYFTTLFNFRDQNFNFNYIENQQLETNERSTDNNMLQVLLFYGYVILGYDADSFSPLGGTACFRRAEEIANAMQSSQETGWRAFESDRNRYALINGILDEELKPVRATYYEYHRLGLDAMSENPDNARSKIASALLKLKDANNARPSNITITSFLDAKVDEIADIFTQGQAKERSNVYDLLMDIAPGMSKRFEKIHSLK
jgi:hypothetical protein